MHFISRSEMWMRFLENSLWIVLFIVTLSIAPTDLIAFLMEIHQMFTIKIYEHFLHARGVIPFVLL